MKTIPWIALGIALVGFVILPERALAAKELNEAEFTMVKNQVSNSEGSKKEAAQIKSKIGEKSLVDTGAASLAELTFADDSVTRLGANSRFSFSAAERMVKLEKGAVLIHTPPGNGGVTVESGGVTGAVTGTTLMSTRDEAGNFSFLVMEGGSGKITTKDGKVTEIQPGQMATVDGQTGLVQVVTVNVDLIMDSSPLFLEFSTPMPGTSGIKALADQQAMDIQTEVGGLSSMSAAGFSESSPVTKALATLTGLSTREIMASNNPLLEDSTAAGKEENSVESSVDTAAGGNSSPDTQNPRPPAVNSTPTPSPATPF